MLRLTLFILLSSALFSQPVPDTLWTRTYGGTSFESARSIVQTTDGGYVIAGLTVSFGAGNYDYYVVKTNSNGDTLWTRTYGGAGNDQAYSIQQTADGGYVIAGHSNSFDVGASSFHVVKTNSNGDTVWTHTYGGTAIEQVSSVRQTTDGGYVIAGVTYSYGAGSADCYVVKTNSVGDTLWTRTYGGSLADRAIDIQQTTDGGYAIAGFTTSFGAGGYDAYLVKTNAPASLNGATPTGEAITNRPTAFNRPRTAAM